MRVPDVPHLSSWKLPFVQQVCAGLVVDSDALRWVELSRIGERVQVRRVATEERIPSEDPFSGEDLSSEQSPLAAPLQRLVDRVEGAGTPVALLLPDAHVRERIVDVPAFDDERARERWIQQYVADQWLPGVDASQFLVRGFPLASMFSDAEVRTRSHSHLIVVTRHQTVEAHLSLLREAGLLPFFLGTLPMVIGRAFDFEPTTAQQRVGVLYAGENRAHLGLYHTGHLEHLRTWRRPPSPTDLLTEVNRELVAWLAEATRSQKNGSHAMSAGNPPSGDARPVLYLTGPDAAPLWNAAQQNSDLDVRLGRQLYARTDSSSPNASDRFAPAFGPAVGLAMAALFETDAASHVLDAETRAETRAAQVRTDAFRTLRALAVFVGGFLLLTIALRRAVEFRVEQVGADLAASLHEIRRVEQAKASVAALHERLQQIREMQAGRTRVAPLLQRLAAAAPSDLWVDNLALERPDPETPILPGSTIGGRLQGYSLSKTAPVRFVLELERRSFLTSTHLVYTEALSPAAVQRLGAPSDLSLTAFEIRFRAPLTHLLQRAAGDSARTRTKTD